MSQTPRSTTLLLVALFVFSSVAAAAQVKKDPNPQPSRPKAPEAAKTSKQPLLRSLELVSTTEEARRVAEEESSKSRTAKVAAKKRNTDGLKQGANGAVLEFRPTSNSPFSGSDAGIVEPKIRKKSLLRNIHGSLYRAGGSQASRGNAESGSVGADSKNGKLSIFLQGEHASTTTPISH